MFFDGVGLEEQPPGANGDEQHRAGIPQPGHGKKRPDGDLQVVGLDFVGQGEGDAAAAGIPGARVQVLDLADPASVEALFAMEQSIGIEPPPSQPADVAAVPPKAATIGPATLWICGGPETKKPATARAGRVLFGEWHGLQESNLPCTVLETGVLPKHLTRNWYWSGDLNPCPTASQAACSLPSSMTSMVPNARVDRA